MVVLAASVVTRNGKALMSRQFVEMTRIRIEGLLAAFPKLVGTGKQHTYVETENVRYVYQPLEGMFLVLVTNKQSNILEDLDTLRLLSKVVPEYCGMVDEESVCRNAFELIFAFDEVISLGHKENATLAQVRTYTEMESHEEKLHKMIIQSKINDTKDLMKRKAMEIDKSKVERKLERGYGGGGGSGGFGGGGISSSTYFGEDGGADRMGGASAPRMAPVINDGFGMSGGGGGGGGGGFSLAKGETRTAMPSKGLVLGKGLGKTNAFIESLRAEGDAVEVEPSRSGGPASAPGSAPHAQRPAPGSAESVAILIEEKVSCQLKKDGGLESLEVQGTMQLEIHNDQDAFCRVQVAPLPALAAQRGVQFKTHPNIDKALHGSSNVLALKDPSRPFPTGSALGILKWRCAPKEEAAVPLQLNCWPSISGAQSFVSIEYEATHEFDLHNLQVTIPLPASREVPVVNSCDGEFRHDVRKNTMTWMVDLVDQSNRNGSMEFAVPAADAGSFFPIDIQFSSTATYCGIGVEGVQKSSDGAPVKHQVITKLATDSYTVQ